MPLAHINCASARLERQGRREVWTLDACVAHGYSRENDCGMSGELLAGMYAKQQRRGENISTTALIADCPRQVVLERKVDYTVDPRRLYAAFRGEMAHRVQEGVHRPGSWREVRVWAPHPLEPGQWLSCKPDRVDVDLGILWDIKSSEELPKGHWKTPYPKHAKQLQLNAWLVSNAEYIGEDPPLPKSTTMGPDGTRTKTYGPGPDWRPMPDDMKPKEWNHLYIEYIAFEGSTVLECTKSIQVPKVGGNGTKAARVPDVWDEEDIYGVIEDIYWEVKRGLDELDDPDGYVPGVPQHLVGWPLNKRSPCNWCDVRNECMVRELEDGLPSLNGDPTEVIG